MFYSETLLSKTGPLAQVWLAANREKKLNKNHILKENIQDDVNEIIDERQAPMALRLSAQLLVGLVRIYSRKAYYLWDDCNEALMKLKNWLKPGNVDLPSTQARTANPASLVLPETLTEMDMFAPLPDPDELLREFENVDLAPKDATIRAWDDSQVLPSQAPRRPSSSLHLDDITDLGLDLGDDFDLTNGDTSIERFRDAPAARRASEEFGDGDKMLDDDLDLGLDIGDDTRDTVLPIPDIHGEDDIQMPDADDELGNDAAQRRRGSLSPLSSVRAAGEDGDNAHTSVFEPTEEQESVHQARQVKRRKLLHPDADTELHSSQIRAQQNDRSKILKPATYLPRDPLLLALMNMQKSGGFVSSILGDGRSRGWAPELRGILSLEIVKKSGDLKRKRDRGIIEPEDEIDAEDGQLRLPSEEAEIGRSVHFDDTALLGDGGAFDDDMGERRRSRSSLRSQLDLSPVPDNFDDTTAPLLHPADSGAVSLGTKHAVHVLRDLFGEDCAESAEQRKKTTCLFQDLLPEKTSTRAEATKMFFEVLVLSTKDAVKVDQPGGKFGGPIRIRSKRGLWGDWAEMGAGGEIEAQEQEEAAAAAALESERLAAAAAAAAVAVEA